MCVFVCVCVRALDHERQGVKQVAETVCGMDAVALWRTDDSYLAVEVQLSLHLKPLNAKIMQQW